MKRVFILFPVIIMSCTNNTTQESSSSSTDTTSSSKREVDITMSAKDFTAGAMGDVYYADKRLNKTLELRGVQFGGIETIGKNETNVWANDGDVHWNGTYMCCRFIFQVTNEDRQKILDLKGKYGTVTATLIEGRDNESAPLGQTVLLKEFIFNNVHIELDPEPALSNVSEPSQPGAIQDQVPQSSLEDKDKLYNGIIASDKAYFYRDEDTATRREAYLVKGQSVQYYTSDGLFHIVTYRGAKDRVTTGWMLKSDITRVD